MAHVGVGIVAHVEVGLVVHVGEGLVTRVEVGLVAHRGWTVNCRRALLIDPCAMCGHM